MERKNENSKSCSRGHLWFAAGEEKIFATAKGYEEFKDQWEFLVKKIEAIKYNYSTFHLSRDCFWYKVIDGELKFLEAEDVKWLSKDTFYSGQWLSEDIALIGTIER